MAGRAGPRRKVTIKARMVVEFEHSEWRDLDEDRDEYAARLFEKVKTFQFTNMDDREVVSIEHTGTKGSKEKK